MVGQDTEGKFLTEPLYVEGRVILLVDTPEEAYLAASDAETGKPAWKAARPTGVLGSYATPTLLARDGEPAQIIVAGAVELTGYRLPPWQNQGGYYVKISSRSFSECNVQPAFSQRTS